MHTKTFIIFVIGLISVICLSSVSAGIGRELREVGDLQNENATEPTNQSSQTPAEEKDLAEKLAEALISEMMKKLNEFIYEFQPIIVGVGATTIALILIMFFSLIIILGFTCVRSYKGKMSMKNFFKTKEVKYSRLLSKDEN